MVSTMAVRSERHCASCAIAGDATARSASSSNFVIIDAQGRRCEPEQYAGVGGPQPLRKLREFP
jgi:hypothetical protein